MEGWAHIVQCMFSICGCINFPEILLEDLFFLQNAHLVYHNCRFKINPSALFGWKEDMVLVLLVRKNPR